MFIEYHCVIPFVIGIITRSACGMPCDRHHQVTLQSDYNEGTIIGCRKFPNNIIISYYCYLRKHYFL